jgi:hypothetical protein
MGDLKVAFEHLVHHAVAPGGLAARAGASPPRLMVAQTAASLQLAVIGQHVLAVPFAEMLGQFFREVDRTMASARAAEGVVT